MSSKTNNKSDENNNFQFYKDKDINKKKEIDEIDDLNGINKINKTNGTDKDKLNDEEKNKEYKEKQNKNDDNKKKVKKIKIVKLNKKNIDFIRNRRNGRILAFQTIFTYNFDDKKIDDLLKFEWIEKKYSKQSLEYASSLIKGTIENLDKIDEIIKSRLKNWDFNRISNIDKAILRFSIFSLLFNGDVPEKVIINEAIEIVKLFGSKDSYKFINGILDAVKRSKEPGK